MVFLFKEQKTTFENDYQTKSKCIEVVYMIKTYLETYSYLLTCPIGVLNGLCFVILALVSKVKIIVRLRESEYYLFNNCIRFFLK